MMKNKSIEDITESEFLTLVTRICIADYNSESQHTKAVMEFKRLGEHPAGSDLIYYPDPAADNSPEGIIKTIKEWRAANGKPGFKDEDAS